jgi:hypothetical protein
MPGSSPNPRGIAVYDRDPRLDFFDRIAGGDQAALDDFVRLALDNPRAAARKLAWWLDATSTRIAGSDDARDLDDWRASGDVGDLDIVAKRVVTARLPTPIRMAMAAVVAGGLALAGDRKATA